MPFAALASLLIPQGGGQANADPAHVNRSSLEQDYVDPVGHIPVSRNPFQGLATPPVPVVDPNVGESRGNTFSFEEDEDIFEESDSSRPEYPKEDWKAKMANKFRSGSISKGHMVVNGRKDPLGHKIQQKYSSDILSKFAQTSTTVSSGHPSGVSYATTASSIPTITLSQGTQEAMLPPNQQQYFQDYNNDFPELGGSQHSVSHTNHTVQAQVHAPGTQNRPTVPQPSISLPIVTAQVQNQPTVQASRPATTHVTHSYVYTHPPPTHTLASHIINNNNFQTAQSRKKARKNQQSNNAQINLIQNPSPMLTAPLPPQDACVQKYLTNMSKPTHSVKDVIDHLDRAICIGNGEQNISVIQLREALTVVKDNDDMNKSVNYNLCQTVDTLTKKLTEQDNYLKLQEECGNTTSTIEGTKTHKRTCDQVQDIACQTKILGVDLGHEIKTKDQVSKAIRNSINTHNSLD